MSKMPNYGKNRKRGPSRLGNMRTKKERKMRNKNDSDDAYDSEDSMPESLTEQSSPVSEDLMPKLPEELLKSLYKTPGVLCIAGMVSWELVGKRESNPTKLVHPNLFTFHRFTNRKYRLIVSGSTSAHSVLISEEGEAFTLGRNNCGQLGLEDTNSRNIPESVPGLKGMNIIHAATGRNHTLFVTDRGTVYACGDNKCGQCGVGKTSPQILVPTRIRYNGAAIIKVGCGAEFSMILDINGTLHSFGLPEYGQLGHNTDGKYFVASNKVSFRFETVPKIIPFYYEKSKDGHVKPIQEVAIVDFSCGNNHTVAIDSKKRAFSWGFGGFGRLGHAEQKDESVPRLIKYFDSQSRGVRSVHCGSTYSLAVNETGALFLFGQTKRTGDANMYPKPVQDLTGWNIRSVGTSNTSIVIAADDTIVAWGASPTYGELGMGELQKSTTRPKEITAMEGTNVTQVAMGYSHALLLCDDRNDEVKQKLAELPVFEP